MGALVCIGVAAFGVSRLSRGGVTDGPHNASIAPGLRVTTEEGRGSFSATPGTIGITAPAALEALEPIRIITARPYDASANVEVVAARAVFSGQGTSPGGFRRAPGYPLAVCGDARPHPTGFGPTYPVEELRLVRGDSLNLVFYVRSAEPGVETIRGFRLRYQTADGTVRTVTDDRAIFEMKLDANERCEPAAGITWITPHGDFPR